MWFSKGSVTLALFPSTLKNHAYKGCLLSFIYCTNNMIPCMSDILKCLESTISGARRVTQTQTHSRSSRDVNTVFVHCKQTASTPWQTVASLHLIISLVYR